MNINVAINGFGRIGRLTLRAFLERNIKDFKISAINDLGDIDSNLHLLKYDSVHGTLPIKFEKENESIIIGGNKINFSQESDPSKLPWKKLGIDIVIESTGIFTERDKASLHFNAGAKKGTYICSC